MIYLTLLSDPLRDAAIATNFGQIGYHTIIRHGVVAKLIGISQLRFKNIKWYNYGNDPATLNINLMKFE